jgi:serine protease
MRGLALLGTLLVAAACSDVSDPLVAPEPGSRTLSAVTQLSGLDQVPPFQPGVVVVRLRPGLTGTRVASEHGATVVRELRQNMRVLRVPVGQEERIRSALSRDGRVVFAELSVPRTLGIPCAAPDNDCVVPTDEHFARRWDLHNDGTVNDAIGGVLEDQGLVPDADIDWLEAHDQLGSFTGGALIGIVDTGIFPSHEDLSGRLLVQHDFFNIDPVAEDDHGHGTHASGIMLALGDNGKGVSGVAWGPNVRLAVAKGCGNTIIGYLCWSPDIADGIMWLADQGVAAINLSLGGQSPSSAEQVALQYATARNVLPVCAAGNDAAEVDWPAAFPECMAVSSSRWDDRPASYTSFGPEVEVAAPGGEILHPQGYDMILSTWVTGGYAYLAGTSMAAPQVTGLAGLLHALGVTDAEAKRALIRETADDLGVPGPDTKFGQGRVNVWSAVQAAIGDPPPPPPSEEPPMASFTWSCTDLSCDFSDTSTDDGGVTSWAWDFGDGDSSPVQDPSHLYAAGGSYTVTLTVRDGLGNEDTAEEVVTVADPPPPPANEGPTASFTWSCFGPSCDFRSTSTDDGGIVAWLWDFGEGGWSDQEHPSYVYAEPGTYTVALLVEDAENLLDLVTQEITVTEPPPVLTVVADKLKGQLVPQLSWTGTDKPVDLYRDGERIAVEVPSPGVYEDLTGQRGKQTFTYLACLAGTTICSEPAVASY